MNSPMQPDIQIRQLQPHESALYRALRLECLKNSPERFGSTYAEEANTAKLKFEVFIENQTSGKLMFGAWAGAKLIGIAGFDRQERERTRHRGEIVQMYVDPAYRGQNVGERLLRELVQRAFRLEGIEQVQLSVIADNIAAIRMYEKLGFKPFGLQPRYFKVGDEYMAQQFMQLLRNEYLD